MLAVNSRSAFLKSFITEQSRVQKKTYTEEDAYAEILEMSQVAQQIADKLLMTCKQHGFDKLT